MKQSLATFGAGIIFAVGLGLSGMTQPGKVIGFLDFAGNWDPSLALVMAGAVLVYTVGFRARKPRPLFAPAYQLPTVKGIDRRLLLGSALFGIGWGLAGFCPGPALTSLVTLRWEPVLFVAAMLAGMLLRRGDAFRIP